jgi:serine/threonine protein kinase
MATLKRADPSARLTKLKCLGEGSYGAVYKMKDELTGDNVAVKVVPVEKDLEDLMNEIKILKQCKSPYITQYITSYLNGGDEIWVRLSHTLIVLSLYLRKKNIVNRLSWNCAREDPSAI